MHKPRKLALYVVASLATFILYLSAPFISYNSTYEELTNSLIRHTYETLKEPPTQSDEFLFVDVSRSKILIDIPDGSGSQAVTDRQQLAQLLNTISVDRSLHYKIVVCDLLFDESTPADDSLENALKKIQPLLLPYGEDQNGPFHSLFQHLPGGYAGYETSKGWEASDKMIKYDLWPTANGRTIPLRMRELINNTSFHRIGGFLWDTSGLYYRNFIPAFELTTASNYLPGGSSFYYLKELNTLFQINPAAKHQFLENRIIVIGDFSNDMHLTYAGRISGSHMLANTYQSFANGDNKITLPWLFYVLLCSIAVAFIFIEFELNKEAILDKLRNREGASRVKIFLILLAEFASLTLALWVLSFMSYFLFHRFLNSLLVFCAALIWAFINKQFHRFNFQKYD